MDKLLATDISHGDYETYLPALMEKFVDVSKEEVLKKGGSAGIQPLPEILRKCGRPECQVGCQDAPSKQF